MSETTGAQVMALDAAMKSTERAQRMFLRDQFAMAALTGMCANIDLIRAAGAQSIDGEAGSGLSVAAYKAADFMLKARANPPEDK